MAFKRALVVDDSRTARQSLARLLAQYDIEVAFAESGEAALKFLHDELVDVIFMDHTMPGMDGLEAVSAIKSNPRTATIPVMMYTTKEGEVYVSQARALGAVGVLPKQFHPGVLFDMLQKLGLVTDRRSGAAPSEPERPRRRYDDTVDDPDDEYERRALGVSVQTLIERILEEQHLKLRAEILSGQRIFARQVAREILEQSSDTDNAEAPADTGDGAHPLRHAVVALLGVVVAILALFGWQMTAQRDAALLEVSRLESAARSEVDAMARRQAGLDDTVHRQQQAARRRAADTADALQWALNRLPPTTPSAQPFGDAAAAEVSELLRRLERLDFRGTVTITAVLAPYCFSDEAGELRPAPPDTALEDCAVLGHPAGETSSVSALQSVAFAGVVAEADADPDVDVRLAVRHLGTEELAGATRLQAGEWNRRAAAADRLEFALSYRPGAAADLAARP